MSEERAHTPGPWTFDNDWNRFPAIFGSDGTQVAIIERDTTDKRGRVHELPERKANACVIVAAPDLLDALKALLSVVKNNPAMQGRQFVSVGIQVNAAIAKAEGRS